MAKVDEYIKTSTSFVTRSDYVRKAIEWLKAEEPFSDLGSPEEFDGLMRHIARLITDHEHRMYDRVANLEQTLGKIMYQMETISTPESIEISNYLEMISKALYYQHREKTLQITNPIKLLPMLSFEYHGEYLGDWIQNQKELRTLREENGRLYWNIKRIDEVYPIEDK